MTKPLTPSNAYLGYSQRLMRLHALIRTDNDAEEADSIRDEMDDYYDKLEPFEIERLERLSADLNSLGPGPVPQSAGPGDEDFGRELAKIGREADPEKIRSYLESEWERSALATWIRFQYWARLGEPEAARPFAQSLLAYFEDDLTDLDRRFRAEAEDLASPAPRSGDPDAEDLSQRRDHVGKSIEQLGRLRTIMAHLKSRIGGLDAPDPAGEVPASPPRDSPAFNPELAELAELASGLANFHQAA